MLEIVAFDADDTLWNNELYYIQARSQFASICSCFVDPELAADQLETNEIANIPHYGYGIKSFTLSMIETAIQVSNQTINSTGIQEILGIARKMLDTDIELLDHVEQTLAAVYERYPLMLITKGDPSEQEKKIERSGLAKYFRHIEIIGEKNRNAYQVILKKYHIQPERFLMIGNSLKSDILPVLEIGGKAIYIPQAQTWSHEIVSEEPLHDIQAIRIEHFGQLLAKIEELSKERI